MVRIRLWVVGKRKKMGWSEPQLPPFIKINPDSPPGMGGGLQPGDMSMGAAAAEFLEMDEGEDEAEPEPVWASRHPGPGLPAGFAAVGLVLVPPGSELAQLRPDSVQRKPDIVHRVRSEERRVGKEC